MGLFLVLGLLAAMFGVVVALVNCPLWFKVGVVGGAAGRFIASWLRFSDQGLQLDALAYHGEAVAFQRSLLGRESYEPAAFVEGKSGWTTTLGFLYYLGGDNPLVGFFFNSLIIGLASLVVYGTARMLDASETGASVAGLCLLAPQFLVWGTGLLREPVIWLALAGVTFFGVQLTLWPGKKPLIGVIGLLVSVGVLYWYRASIGLVAILALLFFVLVSSKVPRALRALGAVAAVVALPFVVGDIQERDLLDADRMSLSRAELAAADTGFGPSTNVSAIGIYLHLPFNFARVLLGPFPWEIVSLGPVAAVEWLCWLLLAFPIAYLVYRRAILLSLPVVLALSILGSIALTVANYGGVSRVRLMPLVVAFPLLALWWDMASSSVRAKSQRLQP